MKLKNIILSTAFLIAFSACDDLFEPAVENFKQPSDLENMPSWAVGLLGHVPKLSALRYNRLLPDRAKQHLRHYPYAGIRTDSHLLPADICLSCHAPVICRRHCLDSVSDIFVLPVQGLSTSTSGGHYVLLAPVYRGGQSVLPATDIVHSPFLDRRIQFPGTHS